MRRIAALLLLLGAEVALALSLRELGWFETGHVIRWAACGLAALLPLVVAAILMLRNRLRFSLRSLLMATALVSVFLFISVLPLIEAFDARKGSQRLQIEGVQLSTESMDDYYRQLGYDPRPAPPKPPVNRPLAAWLRPLAGDVLALPTDDAIKSVWLETDGQVLRLCAMPSTFCNLEQIGVGPNVSPAGLQVLGGALTKFPQLTALNLGNVSIAKNWLKSLRNAKTLLLVVEGPLEGRLLEPQHLKDLADLPNLEVLMIAGYLVRSADLQALSSSKSLRFILLKRTATAPWGKKELAEAMPNCVIRSNGRLVTVR
jgi:hypothetical protein